MTTDQSNDKSPLQPDAPGMISRRLAVGSLLVGAAIIPAVRASASCSQNPANTNIKNVKLDYCAMGDGVTDDTAAIQAAANSGESLYFPPGTYLISDTITLPNAYDLIYLGSGKGETTIKQTTSGKDAFSHNYTYFRISWRDLSIIGDSGTGHGIKVTGIIYNCDFTELSFYMGGSGVYSVTKPVFSTLFSRCEFSSHDTHGIEIHGGNTCTFLQCYAQNIQASSYGYRVYSQALMLGCTGIDSGGGWGLFGCATSDGDAQNIQYQLTCLNCNIEDHTTEGIRLKYDGTANIINSTFLAPSSGTYDSDLRIDFCDRLISLENCAFTTKGAVLSSGRTLPISSPATANIKAINCGVTEYQSVYGAYKLASEVVTSNEYKALGTILNSLKTDTLAISGPAQASGAGVAAALTLGNTASSTATGGSATPPSQVAGYLNGYLNGQAIRIPYFNA